MAVAMDTLDDGAPDVPLPRVAAGTEKPTTLDTGRRGLDEDAAESDDWRSDAQDFLGPAAGFGTGAGAAEVEAAGAGALEG